MTTQTQTPKNNAYLGSDFSEKKPDISILNQDYTDGDSIDQDVFSEMRSSVLPVAGTIYTCQYRVKWFAGTTPHRS